MLIDDRSILEQYYTSLLECGVCMRIEATYEVLYLYRNQFIIAINIDTYCNNRNIYIYPRSPDIQQEEKKIFYCKYWKSSY